MCRKWWSVSDELSSALPRSALVHRSPNVYQNISLQYQRKPAYRIPAGTIGSKCHRNQALRRERIPLWTCEEAMAQFKRSDAAADTAAADIRLSRCRQEEATREGKTVTRLRPRINKGDKVKQQETERRFTSRGLRPLDRRVNACWQTEKPRMTLDLQSVRDPDTAICCVVR
jgi:ribosomal protein L37AE/L43A